MKKGFAAPLTVLAVILIFSIWNNLSITAHTDRWRTQLQHADLLSQSDDWGGVCSVLADSYGDWSKRQTYLHIVLEHDAINDAETTFHRAMAFAKTQEITEFRAELFALRQNLRLLAETERFSLKNIL